MPTDNHTTHSTATVKCQNCCDDPRCGCGTHPAATICSCGWPIDGEFEHGDRNCGLSACTDCGHAHWQHTKGSTGGRFPIETYHCTVCDKCPEFSGHKIQ